MLYNISMIISFICVFLALAFFTLLERKILSYMQFRKGPNKVALVGLAQPLADALKLLSKEHLKLKLINKLPYFISPIMSLFLALVLWHFSLIFSFIYIKWGLLFFICVSSVNVYGIMIAGWSSNSKYALLGALRSVAQSISYEISMVIILLFPIILVKSFSCAELNNFNKNQFLGALFLVALVMWLISCIAETNRAPFDFAEGESELVSGFNVEYGGIGFTLIFMAEYANILFMSFMTSLIFLGGCWFFIDSFVFLMLKTYFVSIFFVWVRASFPRFRYDLLMNLMWKSFLPIGLSFLFFVMCMMVV
uniref:NADH-ubiquinone oxidoreductase chain 1 n=1 Tax=Pleuropoma jana TaxID=1882665 RepID=A0A1B2G3A0_9GAST|nr:NADH dehydrogenase subunit 1 [Pleuropoma jana]